MMTEHVKRFLSMLVEALLGQAHRLARLAAVRHEVESYSLAYEEADSLEASGKPELAKLLRAELEQTIGTALHGRPCAGAGAGRGRQSPPFRTGAAAPRGGAWPLSRPAGERTATSRNTAATSAWATARVEEEPNEGSRGYQAGSGGSLPGTTPTRSDIIMGRKRLTLATERGPVSMLPRILCAVVVDVSASTFASGALDAIIAALPQFRDSVLKDSLLTRKLSWAIVAFSDTTQVLFPYGPVTEWVPPEALEHGNGTAMATAIIETIHLQAEHVEYLGEQGIPVQHKLIFLITDAYPNNEPPERLDEAAELIEEAETETRFLLL